MKSCLSTIEILPGCVKKRAGYQRKFDKSMGATEVEALHQQKLANVAQQDVFRLQAHPETSQVQE